MRDGNILFKKKKNGEIVDQNLKTNIWIYV